MKRILVPFDGSASARRALEHAVRLVAPQQYAWLHLLNVQLPLVEPWPSRELDAEPIRAELHRQGLAVLALAEAEAAALSVPCELEVRIGHPAEQILAAAEDHGCHEIVLGADGAYTQAHRVRERASVPVTLVH
jgi:nucleotide-binding universal stress UspA family protein